MIILFFVTFLKILNFTNLFNGNELSKKSNRYNGWCITAHHSVKGDNSINIHTILSLYRTILQEYVFNITYIVFVKFSEKIYFYFTII